MKFKKLNEAFAIRELERQSSVEVLSEAELFELEQEVIFGNSDKNIDIVESVREILSEEEDSEEDEKEEDSEEDEKEE